MAFEVPTLVEKCPLIFKDVDIYNNGPLQWLEKEIQNPEAFGKHILASLMINGVDIGKHVLDLEKQYKAGDWWQIGYDVGSIVSEGAVGQSAPTSHPVVAASDMNGVLGWLEAH